MLAGSAAYAVAEVFGWPSTLEAKFPEAIGFYVIILAATIIGFAMGFLPINPIQLLVWTAVINGIVAVPIMAMMMLIVTNRKAMGRFQARPTLAWAGWGATALMGVTVVALLWSTAAFMSSPLTLFEEQSAVASSLSLVVRVRISEEERYGDIEGGRGFIDE